MRLVVVFLAALGGMAIVGSFCGVRNAGNRSGRIGLFVVGVALIVAAFLTQGPSG